TMKRINVTDLYHNLLGKLMTKESIIVDATCGNGHDTLFLAKRVKHVYAFDIQQSAINHSKLLTRNYNNVTYYLKSHTLITELVETYDGVVFNLGYLPGSDKLITTHRDTTILALKKLHLKKRGFIILVAYPGHKEG